MADLVASWPNGTVSVGVRFVENSNEASAILDLPAPTRRQAIPVPLEDVTDLQTMLIPIEPTDDLEWNDRILTWLNSGSPSQGPMQLLTLHGTRIYFQMPRLVIVATAERIPTLKLAVLETAYYELELRAIETQLAEIWPDFERDAQLAFAFLERDLQKRQELSRRFHEILLLRSRLAKISPKLMIPPIYPPTLASQAQERLRERLGMAYRLEALETQLEVFERIYDGCSQRASDYVLARKSWVLEWVIIILLAFQVFLSIFDWLVTAAG